MTTAAADDGHEATGWRWRSAECLVWTTSPEHDSSVMMVMMMMTMMTLTMVNLMLMTMTMMKTMAMMDIGQRAGRGRVERVSCISDLS